MSETVTTWANAYGAWLARVTLPGYGPDAMERNASRIRAKARRAIRREILARENGPIRPVRLEVAEQDLDGHNVMRSITFRELTPKY